MNTTAEVYLWRTRIGIIHQDLEKAYASIILHERNFKCNRNKNRRKAHKY